MRMLLEVLGLPLVAVLGYFLTAKITTIVFTTVDTSVYAESFVWALTIAPLIIPLLCIFRLAWTVYRFFNPAQEQSIFRNRG